MQELKQTSIIEKQEIHMGIYGWGSGCVMQLGLEDWEELCSSLTPTNTMIHITLNCLSYNHIMCVKQSQHNDKRTGIGFNLLLESEEVMII